MNAETWVSKATEGLPDIVTERVRRDTLEHLQEAALPDGADVEFTLGTPEDTAQELKRLYLTEAEFGKLSRDMASFATIKAITSIGTLWMVYLVFQQPFPFLLVTTLLYVVGVVLAWRLPPLRQLYWLLNLSAFLSASYLMTYGGRVSGLPQLWLTLLVTVLLCWRSFGFWQKDRKLVRTLRLMA